jgi:WD40 repeat protein
MEFNYTDEMLASVDTKGLVNIWNLKNGKLLRKIDKETSLNAICWGVDPSHLLVGYKETIKLYGIRSCNILKQYKCSNAEYISTIFVS